MIMINVLGKMIEDKSKVKQKSLVFDVVYYQSRSLFAIGQLKESRINSRPFLLVTYFFVT